MLVRLSGIWWVITKHKFNHNVKSVDKKDGNYVHLYVISLTDQKGRMLII